MEDVRNQIPTGSPPEKKNTCLPGSLRASINEGTGAGYLEQEFESELSDAGISGASDTAEASSRRRHSRVVEVHPV